LLRDRACGGISQLANKQQKERFSNMNSYGN